MRKRKGRHARPVSVLPSVITRSTARLMPVALLGGAAAASVATGVAADASSTHPALPEHPDANMSTEAAVHPVVVTEYHHVRHRKIVTVQHGDTLSGISSDRCGAAGKWEHIYAANRKVVGSNPNLIEPGQHLRAWCREAIPVTLLAAVTPKPAHDGDSGQPQPAQQPAVTGVSGVVSGAGMSAFEQCVIQRESGGNPVAQNPSSTASGLFQFLDSTWNNYDGYPRAMDAPVSVQEQYFAIIYAQDGTSPWAPYDGC